MIGNFIEINMTIMPKLGKITEFKSAIEKFSVQYNGSRNAFRICPDGSYCITDSTCYTGYTVKDYEAMLYAFDGLLEAGKFDITIYGADHNWNEFYYRVEYGRFVFAGPWNYTYVLGNDEAFANMLANHLPDSALLAIQKAITDKGISTKD